MHLADFVAVVARQNLRHYKEKEALASRLLRIDLRHSFFGRPTDHDERRYGQETAKGRLVHNMCRPVTF